jgi:RNA polymerase sigma-70 factor (ECF subfamily)
MLTHTTPGFAGRESAGDVALRALHADNAREVLAYAHRFTADRGLAEEIVQETFLRASRNLDQLLADPRPPRTWLLHVARNLLTDAARSAQARPALSPWAVHRATEPSVDGNLGRLLDRIMLNEAIGRLSPVHRQVVIATFFEDQPLAATARRLGVPAGTVRSRLHYALAELRAMLAGDDRLAKRSHPMPRRFPAWVELAGTAA